MTQDTTLINNIKFNCDVSDAKYWGYFSVCGLLLRYRDLYLSERGLKPWAEIRREKIARWIEQKETRWPQLEQAEFMDLTIGDKQYHPFAVADINQAIREQGIVYGAGYGMYMKPTFFLAELRSVRKISGLTVYTSGTEYVRDLFTSPGMLQEKTIYLRIEPLKVLFLHKYSELNARRTTALEDAFAQYGFRHHQTIDDMFEKSMEKMSERYAEVLLCHEHAEFREDVPEWKDIIAAAGDRKVEHYLRAIKDLIADTSDYGPYKRFSDTRDRSALSLSIALVEGFRKVLYPQMKEAYEEFSVHQDWSVIEKTRVEGYERFRSQRDMIVNLYGDSSGRDDFMMKLSNVLWRA